MKSGTQKGRLTENTTVALPSIFRVTLLLERPDSMVLNIVADKNIFFKNSCNVLFLIVTSWNLQCCSSLFHMGSQQTVTLDQRLVLHQRSAYHSGLCALSVCLSVFSLSRSPSLHYVVVQHFKMGRTKLGYLQIPLLGGKILCRVPHFRVKGHSRPRPPYIGPGS